MVGNVVQGSLLCSTEAPGIAAAAPNCPFVALNTHTMIMSPGLTVNDVVPVETFEQL